MVKRTSSWTILEICSCLLPYCYWAASMLAKDCPHSHIRWQAHWPCSWRPCKKDPPSHKRGHGALHTLPPCLLPKPKGIDIDPHTSEIIDATHHTLNITNPTLANDCWLCLALGNPWPLAIPLLNDSAWPTPQITNCTLNIPFRIQPTGFNDNNYTCFYKHFQNNSFDIDVGQVTFASCSSMQNVTMALCANPGQVLACGNGLAYSMLPASWTGLCVLASLLPDIEILPGTEPVPIPTFDFYIPRRKRAIEFIPLLVGLGITGALATGSVGMGVAIHTYSRLPQQLADDI